MLISTTRERYQKCLAPCDVLTIFHIHLETYMVLLYLHLVVTYAQVLDRKKRKISKNTELNQVNTKMNNGQNEWISKAEDIADRVSISSANRMNGRNSIAIENRSKSSISRLNITIYRN